MTLCVQVHLGVRQPLLAPLAASHHLVVHLHVAPAAVLSVAVVTAVWTCSWRTWWHRDEGGIKRVRAPRPLSSQSLKHSQVLHSIVKKKKKKLRKSLNLFFDGITKQLLIQIPMYPRKSISASAEI